MYCKKKIKFIISVCFLALCIFFYWMEYTYVGTGFYKNVYRIPSLSRIELPFNFTNETAITVLLNEASKECIKDVDVNKLRLHREITDKENADVSSVFFPKSENSKVMENIRHPGDTPSTVHFVWCGKKYFTFVDYLGMISIIKILIPQKIIFHYNELPVLDESYYYYTWFQELKQSVPYLELRKTESVLTCNTLEPLKFGLQQLAASKAGGIFVGERTILTRLPDKLKTDMIASFFTSNREVNISRGFIMSSKKGLEELKVYMSEFSKYIAKTADKCVTVQEFNDKMEALLLSNSPVSSSDVPPCILINDIIYPKDIINSTSPFSGVARWLFYGQKDRIQPNKSQNDSDLIPMISHYISLKRTPTNPPVNWTFGAYICVLSALHIAGFERVYVHGDEEPVGPWWQKLKTEKVTFIKMDVLNTVFQQEVKVPAHVADVLRILILLQYGGVYQDWNVLWVNPVSNDTRRYDTVFPLDWPKWGAYPEALSIGMFLTKPGAPFLQMVANSFSFYVDRTWALNGLLIPYKIYERHPDTLHIDRHLQVISFDNISHPIWETGYQRRRDDRRPTLKFNWTELSAFHFTRPKYPPSISSYENIRNGSDVFAEIGRKVFSLSGRMQELNNGK